MIHARHHITSEGSNIGYVHPLVLGRDRSVSYKERITELEELIDTFYSDIIDLESLRIVITAPDQPMYTVIIP